MMADSFSGWFLYQECPELNIIFIVQCSEYEVSKQYTQPHNMNLDVVVR